MLEELHLTRPIIFFDLEATGVNPQRDRIVEISVVKIFPDGHHECTTRKLNPTIPIPAAATQIHGISDADGTIVCPFELKKSRKLFLISVEVIYFGA